MSHVTKTTFIKKLGAEGVLLVSRHGERQAERHFRTFRKRAVEFRLSSHACCQREVGGRVSIKFDGRRSRIARLCIGQRQLRSN